MLDVGHVEQVDGALDHRLRRLAAVRLELHARAGHVVPRQVARVYRGLRGVAVVGELLHRSDQRRHDGERRFEAFVAYRTDTACPAGSCAPSSHACARASRPTGRTAPSRARRPPSTGPSSACPWRPAASGFACFPCCHTGTGRRRRRGRRARR
eukprot:scaffold29084_cov60-Phaeocystis_antarctica.AAC.2